MRCEDKRSQTQSFVQVTANLTTYWHSISISIKYSTWCWGIEEDRKSPVSVVECLAVQV